MHKRNVEINDLKIALKAPKDMLINENQQSLKDRKVYDAKVKDKLSWECHTQRYKLTKPDI